MTLRIHIPAVPVAQPRQRHRIVDGHGRSFVHNYTPESSPANAFKATARLAAREACRAANVTAPLTGPLRCDVCFVFPRTAGQVWKRKPMPRLRHAKKPDIDNLNKCLFDAIKGIAWLDDAQVCAGSIEKWIAAGDEHPHVDVTVTALEAP